MLYSEKKERGNRFKIALKIALPFFLMILVYISLLQIYQLKDKEIFLLTLLSICYTYYIFYLIYNSFKTTLIDGRTKAFNREHILSILHQEIKSNKKSTVILLHISNINDINERYGIHYGDEVLSSAISEIYDFLVENGFKKVPIGRYSGGYFIIILDEKAKKLTHLFENLKMEIKDKRDIEVKINFSLVGVDYDVNYKNIINHLLDKMNKSITTNLIKPDVYDKLVCKSIDEGEFVFTYQPILEFLTRKITILEVLTKLHVKEFGNLSNNEINSTIHRNLYEIEYYKQTIKVLSNEIKEHNDKKRLFSINISANILRNAKFKLFIQKLIDDDQITPEKFIFSLYEESTYEEKSRFSEIIKDYKSMGFSIMLTHFGGNNTSLEYIKFLDIDYASFDLDFSKNLDDKRKNIILEQYIIMLKKLGVTSIIKFIETPYLYEIVKKIGADMVQGHLVGKPKKLEYFIDEESLYD